MKTAFLPTAALAALCALAPFAHAQGRPKAPAGPEDPSAPSAPLRYESAFKGYKAPLESAEPPSSRWRSANEAVASYDSLAATAGKDSPPSGSGHSAGHGAGHGRGKP